MHPIFHVFGRELSAYLLFTILAAAATFALAIPALRQAGLSRARAAWLLAAMCAAFLVGARIWNVAINPGNFAGALKWYSLQLAGLSLYGGVLGAGLALAAALHRWETPIFPALDAMTVPGGVAFCIVRIGCYLNGCCAGRATRCIFGVVFPVREASRQMLKEAVPFLSPVQTVHPTQVYELVGAAVGLPLIIWLCRHFRMRDGALFLLYGAWFSAVRLAVLPLRALTYSSVVKTVIYPLIYLLFCLCGIVLALLRGRQRETLFK